jgi:hypothetical protein
MWRTRLTLLPGANGTKKLVERYGERLVCVRYRYDRECGRRLKTVELIEEESEYRPSSALYLVKIGYEEVELRERCAAGGRATGRAAQAVGGAPRHAAAAAPAGPRRRLAGTRVDISE